MPLNLVDILVVVGDHWGALQDLIQASLIGPCVPNQVHVYQTHHVLLICDLFETWCMCSSLIKTSEDHIQAFITVIYAYIAVSFASNQVHVYLTCNIFGT